MTQPRPRVLVISRAYPNDVFPTLGLWVERPTVRLAQRYDVRVVSPVPWCPPLPDRSGLAAFTRFRRVARRELRAGVEVERPRFVVGPGSSTYMLEGYSMHRGVRATVARLHAERPIDLIHAHFVYPEGVVAHKLARRLGVPFVITEHAPWTGWLDRPGVARQALPAARAAAVMMPVSTSVERTIHHYAGEAVRTQVVPVGVDGERFRPTNGARDRDRILFVGFVNYMKGIDVLLRAMQLLHERGSNVRLVLAGGAHYRNTLQQERELRALVTELGLEERVAFAGRQPPEEVSRLMAESAVLVLPSRAESFGAVLVEALACGTPVVATRCGGPEDIVDKEDGVLVPPGDPVALADGIAQVLAAHDSYDPVTLRERALARFGADVVSGRIATLYDEVLGRARD
ncbi:MAG: glycosyltransferase [Gaiellaceae bacterium MAG52_C11]|nr:glycosyltransferase [Candidatus Gaiellasilicea maunaloa]